MAFFSDSEVRDHAFAAVYDEGCRLHGCGRVGNLHFIGDAIVATVNDGTLFRVAISRADRKLQFSCTCGAAHAGACSHAVASMLAANGHAAIQVGINWDGDPDDNEEAEGALKAPPAAGGSDFDPVPEQGPPEVEEVEEEPEGVIDYPPEKPLLRLYLSEREGMLLAELRFAYYNGIVEFSRADSASSRLIAAKDSKVYRIYRSRARESAAAGKLASFDLIHYQTGYYTPSTDPRDWTLHQLSQLSAEGFAIYGQEQLQSTQARKSKPLLGVTVSSSDEEISCSVQLSVDGVPATLAALIMAIRQKSRFILLSDGSSGMIPEAWLETFAALFATLETKPESNRINFKASHIGLAEALCDIADSYSCDAEFQRKKGQLHTFRGVVSQPLPADFRATLREYQHAGYDWFYFLKEFRFGGCLADDMGLGKTVQTLALLLREKQLGEGQPSLVVVPNSLLFNWQREAKKFSPSINLLIYHGNSRHTYSDILPMADVVLTTYGTVLRDLDRLRIVHFHYVIIDEAQAIKNPSSQISKAVRSLDCSFRLALSGTPIENNLSELWSLVTFLNPGMAGSYSDFVKEFIKPVEREMNETRLDLLKKMVYPILLRRTKAQVAKDLPPKTEIVVYAEMVQRQRTMYDITRELFYGRIKDSLDRVGIEGTQLQLLEGMLRLRQICCHPRLYEIAYGDDSGKFQLLEEELHDAVSEGHRILVFSQFVTALELLRERLQYTGLRSEMLTGATRDRQRVVDRFQSGEGAPIFLISLKAGGTGLNLTAADYVFHLDPWWNPSVENQASDRAYRIGQTRPVFVYKLITQDSIEERVLELQEKKRQLADNIIQTESSFFKHLNKGDILHLFEK
jgi:non-specific serine/threonine protein kinase